MKSLFEQMGGSYTLGEDGLYYPNLVFPEEEKAHYGKYGMVCKRYLKKYRKGLYSTLMMEGKLVTYLNEVDDTANARMELLIRQMQEKQGIDEEFKSQNQMAWVSTMNNIRNAAEEIVIRELIYT